MLKNVGENIKKFFAVIFFYTMDIKNTIFNPKVLPTIFAISTNKLTIIKDRKKLHNIVKFYEKHF